MGRDIKDLSRQYKSTHTLHTQQVVATTWLGNHQGRPYPPLYQLYVDFMTRYKWNYLIITLPIWILGWNTAWRFVPKRTACTCLIVIVNRMKAWTVLSWELTKTEQWWKRSNRWRHIVPYIGGATGNEWMNDHWYGGAAGPRTLTITTQIAADQRETTSATRSRSRARYRGTVPDRQRQTRKRRRNSNPAEIAASEHSEATETRVHFFLTSTSFSTLFWEPTV